MTRSRPTGVSFIALLFLAEAIVAVGVAAFLLLIPNSGAGFIPLVERLQLPSAFSSLLAAPPLLTAAAAGLIFRGLWETRDWARMAAIVFYFLLTLTAVAAIAFLFVFEFDDTISLASGGAVLVIAAGAFLYLLTANWETTSELSRATDSGSDSFSGPEVKLAPFVEQAPAGAPPPAPPSAAPAPDLPYDLVPPPPRKQASTVDRQAETIASAVPAETRQLSEPEPVVPAAVDAPNAWLIVRQGPDLGTQYALYPEDNVTLGRDKARVDIVVTDPTISARHFQIRSDQGRYMLRDLGSTNGTYVNGSPVQRQTLLDGDEIRIGSTVLLFTTTRV